MNNQTIPAKGYIIANFTIHDEEAFKKYVEAGGSLAAKFNGKVISYDVKPDVTEGSAEAIMQSWSLTPMLVQSDFTIHQSIPQHGSSAWHQRKEQF